MDKKNTKVWFAMRATYRRELKAKKLMEEAGEECFVPMRYRTLEKGGRKLRCLSPAIHGLVFVHATWERMSQVKLKAPWLQYIIEEDGRKLKHALVVPDRQMEQFIAVAETYAEELAYVEPRELDLKRGEQVRITEGVLKGREGVCLKLKNKNRKNKVVVVSVVVGLVAVIATVPADNVQKVTDQAKTPDCTP